MFDCSRWFELTRYTGDAEVGMPNQQQPSAIPEFARRRARALIGWLPVNEGALCLAGRQMEQQANPDHVARCETARQAVAARPPGIDQNALVAELPGTLQPHVDAIRQTAIGAQILQESGEPKWVDLAKVCAAQPQIFVEDAARRVEGISADDLAKLAAITLPVPTPTQMPVAFDKAKNAWIVSSPNPNLRVAGNFNTPVGPGLMGLGFAVTLGVSYVHVARLGDRYFLRDGYHRAYGLMAVGVRFAPALVTEYNSFEEVGLPQGLLPQAAYLGDRPPLLRDYLDDTVAADTSVPAAQKTVVVQALEVSSVG